MPVKSLRERRDYNIRYLRRHYRLFREEYIERNRAGKRSARSFLLRVKRTQGCVRCGESDVCCLDFHHVGDQPKTAELSELATNGAGVARLQREVAKCLVLCKNCHAKEHLKHLGS